ncbi:MAG: cytochrome c [Trueperaceae bacterium]
MSRHRDPRRRRPWWRRRLAEAAAAAFALLAVMAVIAIRVYESPPRAEATSTVSQEVLDEGAELYQASCASCHGTDREGSALASMPAPPLDGSAHSWHHSDEQIVGLIRRGGRVMPAVGFDWSDEQVEAVLAYVKSGWEPWQREAQQGSLGE